MTSGSQTHLLSKSCIHKYSLFVYFRKNITFLNVGLSRICRVYSGSCNTALRQIAFSLAKCRLLLQIAIYILTFGFCIFLLVSWLGVVCIEGKQGAKLNCQQYAWHDYVCVSSMRDIIMFLSAVCLTLLRFCQQYTWHDYVSVSSMPDVIMFVSSMPDMIMFLSAVGLTWLCFCQQYAWHDYVSVSSMRDMIMFLLAVCLTWLCFCQ
jgi:hypothetical protein